MTKYVSGAWPFRLSPLVNIATIKSHTHCYKKSSMITLITILCLNSFQPSRKLVVESPGPVKYQDFAIAVIIWSPLGILVSREVWMRLLVVEVAGKVMKELWMFPAEQSHPLLVPHVALVGEQEFIDQGQHGRNFEC